MKTRRPTREDMEALASYLPLLYADGFTAVEKWGGGTENSDGELTMPWPEYRPIVEAFVKAASAECWRDYDYNPSDAGQKLLNEAYVRASTIDQIKGMLTYFVRGERFCDGFWGHMIEQGHVRVLLQRIVELTNA